MTPLQEAFRFTSPSAETKPSRANLVIEAGAGTGKTSKIVAEVLELLLENEELSPDRIVLMTFTDKAAGEIADRIHQALAELELHFDDERVVWPIGSAKPLFEVPADRKEAYRQACRKQVTRIDAIRSQTIHSFCQSLLRSYPIEAGLDPQFKIIEGFERSLLYGRLYDQWLDEETRTDSSVEKLQEWEFLMAHVGYLFQIRALVFSLLGRRDLLNDPDFDFGSFNEIERDVRDALTSIRRSDISRIEEPARTVFRYVQQVDPPLDDSLDAWIDYFAPIGPAIEVANLPKDPDLKEALKVLRTDPEKKGSSIHDRLVRHRSAIAIHALARRFIAFLDREKRTLGVADFDDLLLRTADLLENHEVLERVRQQFDYMFVDEFQDTDRTQARIIERLARDRKGTWVPGKLVVVGDPKQSIYGFRRADPETYRSITASMIADGAEREVLRDHYRSDAPLLDNINTLFDAVFSNGGPPDANVFRPQYNDLAAAKPQAGRELDARLTFLQATDDEPEAIARWILKNRGGGDRDLQRFAILFRRMTILDDYLDAFDRHEIDYVLPPTKAFLERRAPVDLLAVLRAIGFEFDRGAEISAARTPYFALNDQEISEGVIDAHPAWTRFREVLDAYRKASSHLTVSGTIDLLIRSAGIEQIYASTADGHRAARHLEHIRALAFEYDQKIGGSIRQFVAEIDRRRTEPDEMEPSLADDDSNAIRILTVHAAKGLEFETVILPDLSFKPGSEGQQLFTVEQPRSVVMTGRAQSLSAHYRTAGPGRRLAKILGEREEAETRRLFYVAVTRAKTDVVFACDGTSFRKGSFYGCLSESFGFNKDTFGGLFEEGRVIRPLIIGMQKIDAAFEAVRTGGLRPPAGARRPPVQTEIVDLDISLPVVAPIFSREDAAIARGGVRNKSAGILLHRFLELWDGNADAEALLRKLASEGAASEQMVGTVRQRINKLRTSPTLKRILAAETIGRELPMRFLNDGVIIERRVDRLIRENGTEVVIDYKSGKPTDERVATDREQVAQYCRAIEAMTTRPCRGMLWYIDVENDVVVETG